MQERSVARAKDSAMEDENVHDPLPISFSETGAGLGCHGVRPTSSLG